MSWDAAPTGRRGRQQTYSDTAIQTCLTMKVLFGMALRQTTCFVESLLRLIGLNWAVPDFSTLSRRPKTLAVNIPYSRYIIAWRPCTTMKTGDVTDTLNLALQASGGTGFNRKATDQCRTPRIPVWRLRNYS